MTKILVIAVVLLRNLLPVIAVVLLSALLWAQVTAPTNIGFDVGPLTSCKSIAQVTICSASDAAGVQGLYISTKASATFTKIATVGATTTPVPVTIPASFKCDSFTATNTVGTTSGATLSGCR